jgi:putative transcriptional regulator
MSEIVSLKNSLIVAMPTLLSPFFYRAVVYMCEHTAEGAMGIIINHPLGITIDDILKQLHYQVKDPRLKELPVLCGGPVQTERGFVIHRSGMKWGGSVELQEGIYITSSREILEAMAEQKGPEQLLVALGYAGWGAGQLEHEFVENSWIPVKADPAIIFQLPFEKRWEAAGAILGIDFNCISNQVGHA